MFVRPAFGDGLPLLHVHRSSYVFVHDPLVRSARPSDWSICPLSFTAAGTPTSVGAAHWIVAVALAALPEPHVAVAVLFGTCVPGATL